MSLIKLSLTKKMVVGVDSGLTGLYIKDSLSGESVANLWKLVSPGMGQCCQDESYKCQSIKNTENKKI